MIDAAGKKVRVALSCGCIYDPNDEKAGPGSGSVAVQGECQIAGAALAAGGTNDLAKKYDEATQAHRLYRQKVATAPPEA